MELTGASAQDEPESIRAAQVVRAAAVHWPIVAVLALFAATAFIVPTLAPVATTDDWGYSRSVEILYREGRLVVFPAVAATAVFQIGWGALFAVLLGMTLGVVRISTLVMVGLGAAALDALLRELGVSRGRSALGTAAYLFNPLSFILAYTFMTDPHLTSLLIISTYFYVRGLRPDRPSARFVVLGSIVAGCAFLTRQQGALVPFAIVLQLLVTRRLRINWASVRVFLQIVAIPVLATAGYYLWLHFFNNVPAVQQGFFNEAKYYGVNGAWLLARHLSVIELMYLGAFTLPIAAALVPGLPASVRGMKTQGWLLFCAWEGVLATGLTFYAVLGGRWPYIPQFVGAAGVGPPDVLGARPQLFSASFFYWATIICAIAAFLIAIFVSRGLSVPPSPERAMAGLVAAVAVWQVVGILPPSFHYITRGYSLDRYLLPLLPFGICLLLWASRDLRLFQPIGWLIVAVFAVFSATASHDYFMFLDNVWQTAADANQAGVENVHLDAGAAWDGYHLYTYALDNHITSASTPHGMWWMTFYGLASDSTYVVASQPQPGYIVVWRRDYSQWLPPKDASVYLLRRAGAAGLPSMP